MRVFLILFLFLNVALAPLSIQNSEMRSELRSEADKLRKIESVLEYARGIISYAREVLKEIPTVTKLREVLEMIARADEMLENAAYGDFMIVNLKSYKDVYRDLIEIEQEVGYRIDEFERAMKSELRKQEIISSHV